MSNFGPTLFSGSRFIFWCVALALAGLVACLTALAWARRDLASIIAVGVSMVVSALLIAGLWNPRRNRWALRCVTGFVFLGYVAYLVTEFARETEPSIRGSRSEPSVWNALTGLLVIGIPCLIFTFRGTFGNPHGDGVEGLDERVPGPDDALHVRSESEIPR